MAGFAHSAAYAAPGPAPRWQRAGGATLVLLLHLMLLLAALRAVIAPGTHPPRETILTLAPSREAPPPAQIQPAPTAATSPRAITLPPIIPPSPPAMAVPSPKIQSLGQSLFNCGLENLANLTPEQRALCGPTGMGPPDANAVTEPRSHVKNPELRAAEMEKKNTPGSVPCVSIETQTLGNSAQEQIFMVDPVCAAREAGK